MARDEPEAKRKMAAKVRLLAARMVNRDDMNRVLEFAALLDSQADALERDIAQRTPPSTSRTEIQMQQQQHHEADPPNPGKPRSSRPKS